MSRIQKKLKKVLDSLHIKVESVFIEIIISLALLLGIHFKVYSFLSEPLQLIMYKVLILSLAVIHARVVRKLIVGDIDIDGDKLRLRIDNIIRNKLVPEELKSTFILFEIFMNAVKLFFVIMIYVAFIIGYSLAI